MLGLVYTSWDPDRHCDDTDDDGDDGDDGGGDDDGDDGDGDGGMLPTDKILCYISVPR